MARPIDADELKNQIKHMPRTVNPDLVQYKLVQAIIADMPTLTPPNEWVSVEDSIPCSGKRVLATDGSFVGEAWYASFSKSWYRNNGFEWDRICGQVTHWMPLPAPPKKEHDHE